MCIRDRSCSTRTLYPDNESFWTTSGTVATRCSPGARSFTTAITISFVLRAMEGALIIPALIVQRFRYETTFSLLDSCLLYTSDAADDLTRVDLGGRRIIQK